MAPWLYKYTENISHEWRCSNCGYVAMRYSHMIYNFRGDKPFSKPNYNYCPNCGENMEENMKNNVVIGDRNHIVKSKIGVNSLLDKCEIIVNGVRLPEPPTGSYNVTMINNKVYIDGYEFKNGKWKKTFMAWWHLWF